MAVQAIPGFQLIPSSSQVPLASNYITDFNFLNQYLPDTYEKEFERYGNRTISSFLRMVGAEMPSNSDLIKWAEQGRLHIKYVECGSDMANAADTGTIQVNDNLTPNNSTAGQAGQDTENAFRVGQTVMVVQNNGSGSNKGIITSVDLPNSQFEIAFYEAGGYVGGGGALADTNVTVWIYGSEFKKGQAGMEGSLQADDFIFDNSPIILKDNFAIAGSDMAQIGWIEITTEDGASGYLWYLKSEHETRLRFDDYLETAMIEAVPAEANSGAIGQTTGPVGNKGSEGVFHAVETRGNVYSGIPAVLQDFDDIISRLDKQGSIEENVIFLNRQFSFDLDDMLAAQNSYGAGGTSYGLFDNDEEMALNLGFTGFRRGYDFYKSDWKYLNDPTMRGDLPSGSGLVSGLLVPAGSTTVYDQILGKNAKRPFLHVRYRASETEDRRYKTWIVGSAGGAATTTEDEMRVSFLSERCVCTLGANNFFIFQD